MTAQRHEFFKFIKYLLAILVIIFSIYIISQTLVSLELIFGFLSISIGILSIIWTLLAKYSLSPKSTLRLFTNNFLTCSIAVLSYSFVRVLGNLIYKPWFILVEFFFIFVTFFFFLIASYYIYSIGKEFGFQKESKKIREVLLAKKKRKR